VFVSHSHYDHALDVAHIVKTQHQSARIMLSVLANGKPWALTFGISDLNGIAYWILRRGAGPASGTS
jgi:metal-dependent hydrolase (beta-lactamase superfamily II)